MPWILESFASYRLEQAVLEEYLRGKFGNYDFRTEHRNDHYCFRIPRKLSELEKGEVLDLREAAYLRISGFACSCDTAIEYPRNLLYHNIYEHNLIAYIERLDEREGRLFSDEAKACLDFWEFDEQAQEFQHTCAHNQAELEAQLTGPSSLGRTDPRCRFVFVHAPHSRERLETTRKMLMFTLTYHQVMPEFLDFLDGERIEGSRVRTFRRDIRVCYSLKSVERSKGQRDWPWSIRQTAIYHSFDLETGLGLWIIVKGNRLMKHRVESTTGPHGFLELTPFGIKDRAFASALLTHLIFCDWSGENWRWYVNFLEEALQEKTRRTLLVRVDKSSSPVSKTAFGEIDLPTPQPPNCPSPHCPPGHPTPEALHFLNDYAVNDPEEFSFSDLQRIQFIGEKADETLLALKANVDVLMELKQLYRFYIDSRSRGNELGRDCGEMIARFEKRIRDVANDLRMQQSRVETLLRFLADWKSLLYGILQYWNMEASKQLAKKAQQSADNMEVMTSNMYDITQKTKQETVSMKIITLVTLFFLPGTFISTLMSTDIIRFQTGSSGKPEKVFHFEAFRLYLAISVPLVSLTFSAWYGVYWWRAYQKHFTIPIEGSAIGQHADFTWSRNNHCLGRKALSPVKAIIAFQCSTLLQVWKTSPC
ncbi:MAG: hypothetical protein M1840_000246 [Geoglossum simile]|nr:MAG: hypothetical protein M1840_000246 [Geoglossum simile]